MILVDKSIKERSGEIFCEGYAEKYVNAISYDLHIKGVICDDALKDSYTLHPGEFIFVQTREMIHMPKDLIGRIGEKNSRIRQGLSVAGPHYYPGHKTYIYLRIQNITCANITIRENDSIAQIIFEQLESVPEKAYDEQEDASFNDEYQYRGLANYRDEYEARTEELKKANESLEEKENHIYANILTFMGIFVSIFSLIFQILRKER